MSGPLLVSPDLLRAIATVVGDRAREPADLVAAVAELWKLFTKERSKLGQSYLDQPHLRAAYLQYYLPVNAAKVQFVLRELPPVPMPSFGQPFRVLDVGAGPGTASLAVLDWAQSAGLLPQQLYVTALDHSRKTLDLAANLWRAMLAQGSDAGAQFIPETVNLERAAEVQRWRERAGGPFNLIVIANSLNEWFLGDRDPVGRRAKIVAQIMDALASDGSLVIVEPALRESSRALHALRDRLLEQQRCTVYSPCLHEAACPALLHLEDWCHEERAWAAPPHIQELDQHLGFIKDAVKFSYLVLRKDGATIVPRNPELLRIVSEQRPFKGELRMWACGEGGRREIGRLDKERSASNAVFDACQRGTILQCEKMALKANSKLARISAETHLKIIRSA